MESKVTFEKIKHQETNNRILGNKGSGQALKDGIVGFVCV